MKFKFLKKITYKWHIKLLSLALASILWIYVDNLKETERFISLTLEVRNIPDKYMVSNGIPGSVKVILKGKESRLALFDEEAANAYLDLENRIKKEQKQIVKIDKDMIPQGVSIKEINPRIIDVVVERIEEKFVKIVPVITNEPPYGYYFEDVIVDPEKIRIKGPESLVKDIDTVYTKDVSIKNATETTMMEVGLDISDTRILLDNDAFVSVRIIIKEQYVAKRMNKNTVIPLNLDEKLSVEMQEVVVSVLLKLPKRLEQGFSTEQFRLFVDCKDIDTPGSYELPILFETEKKGVSLINTEPKSINIEVSA